MDILKVAKADAKKKKEGIIRFALIMTISVQKCCIFRIRIKRMIEQMELSKKSVEDYRLHQIRAFASEQTRKEILENLQDKEAMIVLDFALKIIPTSSM